jgi:hypothetical protein
MSAGDTSNPDPKIGKPTCPRPQTNDDEATGRQILAAKQSLHRLNFLTKSKRERISRSVSLI